MRFPSQIPYYVGISLCVGMLIAAYVEEEEAPLLNSTDVPSGSDRGSDSPLEGTRISVLNIPKKVGFPPTATKEHVIKRANRPSSKAFTSHLENSKQVLSRDARDKDRRTAPSRSDKSRSSQRRNAVAISEPFPSRRELGQMAQKAEQQANHELDRLIETLDLSEDQQDVVFEILARTSDHYLPAMELETDFKDVIEPLLESTESVEEAIEVVLDEEQATRYKEDLEEEEAWWLATLRDFIPDEELPEVMAESESYYP